MTLNRRREMVAPVLFVRVRRSRIVPKVLLLPGSEVGSYTKLVALPVVTEGSIGVLVNPPLELWIGPSRFSGPGVASNCPRPETNVPFVSPKRKSAALLLVSLGVPEARSRNMVYCRLEVGS